MKLPGVPHKSCADRQAFISQWSKVMINKTEIMESKCVVCGNYILNEVPVKELDFERKREWIEKHGVCDKCKDERDVATRLYLECIEGFLRNPESLVYKSMKDAAYKELQRLKIAKEDEKDDTEDTVEEES